MRFWRPRYRESREDPEAPASGSPLEAFEVELIPPPLLSQQIKARLDNAAVFLGQCLKSCLPPSPIGCLVLSVLLIEFIFLLINYYDAYQSVFPSSSVAAHINRNRGTGAAWVMLINVLMFLTLILTIPLAFVLWKIGAVKIMLGFTIAYVQLVWWIPAVPLMFVWTGICLFLGTWQFWIHWLIAPIWSSHIWDNACYGWNMTAVLSGIFYNAKVVLEHGNYTMQLALKATNPDLYYFQVLNTFNYTPPISNITYDVKFKTYTINNITENYITDPNLSFPSLNLSLADTSIPFKTSYGPPNANLIYHSSTGFRSNILYTAATANDCTELKVCGTLDPAGVFEIALGVVMIQFLYSDYCITGD